MSKAKKRFSNQNESLFDEAITAKYIHPLEKEETQNLSIKEIDLNLISPGKYQPRKYFEEGELTGLAESIMLHGVMQPIIVRPVGQGDKYELIAGERRWRACKLAHTKTIPAIVRHLKDKDAMALGVIENIQRSNLNPIEEAMAYKRLLDEFEMTHEKVSQTVGKSRASISNALRLLSLPEEIKQALASNIIQAGHAKAMLSLDDHKISQAFEALISKKLSVRETEALVKSIHGKSRAPAPSLSQELVEKQQLLSSMFQTKVKFRKRAGRQVEVVFTFANEDRLEDFLEKICDLEN